MRRGKVWNGSTLLATAQTLPCRKAPKFNSKQDSTLSLVTLQTGVRAKISVLWITLRSRVERLKQIGNVDQCLRWADH